MIANKVRNRIIGIEKIPASVDEDFHDSTILYVNYYNTPVISDWCLSQTKYLTLHHYGKEHKKKVHSRV